MKIINYTAKRTGREFIGDAVARTLKEMNASTDDYTLIAIVPRMLSYFANCPERYEVTEVDILVRVED